MVLRLVSHFTYAAIFGLLVGAGVGLPLPEELTQLTAGFLSSRGVISFWPALAATYVGIVLGDYLLFRLGRSHGARLLESRHVCRLVTPRRRAFLERHFSRHSVLTIMVARHASGLRVPTFALAGASGVKDHVFLLADGFSALLSVPLVVTAGYLFAEHFEDVRRRMHEVELTTAIAVAVIALILWRRRASRIAACGPRIVPGGLPAEDRTRAADERRSPGR